MFKFPRAFLSNLLFSLNQLLSSTEPENENKLQMVSTGYFGKKKNLLEKIRTNYDWDKMHVTIFIIYPELSKKSLIEGSTDSLLNCRAEVLNFSLGSLVVGRICGGREDHAIVLSRLQISCSLGTLCLPQVGDVWVGASVELPLCPLPGPWCQRLLAVPRGLSLFTQGTSRCWISYNATDNIIKVFNILKCF